MSTRRKYQILKILIAVVWLTNGLLCKVMNMVPRHQDIVERILRTENARFITLSIGIAETGMSIWIISGIWPKLNAATQIVIIIAMNILELILAPDLLLWGRANAIFALLFVLFIYYNEFHLNRKLVFKQ